MQKTEDEMRMSDWSSDVCSSDLLYRKINALIPNLVIQAEEDGPGDFSVDEKAKQVHLTEAGHEKVENLMRVSQLLGEEDSLYDAANIVLLHHLNDVLRAHHLYTSDVEYILRDNQIDIHDAITGRMMPGRRSDARRVGEEGGRKHRYREEQ